MSDFATHRKHFRISRRKNCESVYYVQKPKRKGLCSGNKRITPGERLQISINHGNFTVNSRLYTAVLS